MEKQINVAILYRVIQEWRRPIFNQLNALEDFNLTLYHGPDFEGSKVVSSKKEVSFRVKREWSIKLRKESKNGLIAMPISLFLLFSLVRDRPDVVVAEGASNLFNALIGFFYCKLFGRKFIWWSLGRLKGTIHTGYRKKLDSLIQYVEKNSDAIISYSSLGKDYFESIGVPPDRIFVAVNVVDTTSKLEELKQINDLSFINDIRGDAEFVVLFVGAFTPQKKIDLLIQAFGEFSRTSPGAKLILVGDGPERDKLRDMIVLNEYERIEMPGKIFDGVYRYFLSSDLFVLPGLGGLAVSEAMLYGVPVIASVGDGCEKDLIVSGENGIIDEAMKVSDLINYLKDLYENPSKLSSYKIAAAKTIKEKYNIESYLEQIEKAIKS